MPDSTNRSRFLVAGALVLLVGLLLRTYHVGEASLWMDEGFTYKVARVPLAEVPQATIEYERAPPLYFLIVHGFLSLSDSETSLRAASFVPGVLTVAAAVWLGWLAFGPLEGVLGGLLLAVSALHLLMSQDARNYGLATLFATLSTCLWLHELRWPGRPATLVLYAVTSTLAVYTHYVCFAVVGLQWLCGIVPLTRRIIVPRLCAAAAIVLAFLPWLPHMIAATAKKSSGRSPVAFTVAGWDSIPDVFFVQMAGFFLNFRTMWVWYGLATLGLGLLLTPWVTKRDPSSRLLLVVGGGTIGALIFASMIFHLGIYNARYLVLVSPVFWVLAARTVTLCASLGMRLLSVVLLLALLIVNLVSSANLMLFDEWHRQDWRGAVDQVARSARAGDLVLLEPEHASPSVEYYWSRRPVPGQLVAVTPEIAASISPADLAGAPRVWLVEGEGGMVDPGHRIEQLLKSTRPVLQSWEAYRRGASLTVRTTLYGACR